MTPELNTYTVTYLMCKKWVWFNYWWLASPTNWSASIHGLNKKSFSKNSTFTWLLIFTISFLVGVTPTETDHEKGCIKVIHIYNKQKLKLFKRRGAFHMLLQCVWQTTCNWTLCIQKIIVHMYITCIFKSMLVEGLW